MMHPTVRLLEVFRFWTFLKSAGAQGLYGALDLKNILCAKNSKILPLLYRSWRFNPIMPGGWAKSAR